jgi:hypothetical protein
MRLMLTMVLLPTISIPKGTRGRSGRTLCEEEEEEEEEDCYFKVPMTERCYNSYAC